MNRLRHAPTANLAVRYAGRFVETGPTRAVIRAPRHPYTQGLLASTVRGAIRGQPLEAIPGMPPDLGELPTGCSFAARCRHVEERCHVTAPGEHYVAPDHTTRYLRVADGSPPGSRGVPCDKQLGAIVVIEMPMTRLIGKWKVSQNRPAADNGAAEGLRRRPPRRRRDG